MNSERRCKLKMYLTQKNQIRGLSSQEFETLRVLCRLSKNLYNVGLYSIRQYFFQEKKFLRYESNYHYCKTNENYKLLNTDIAQQTLKVADRSFRSFFNLLKLSKDGRYQAKVNLPKYLHKEGYFPLIMPRFRVKGGFFIVPMSNVFKKQYGEVKIPFPERLKDKTIKEVRIHPKSKARFFEIEYIYEQEEEIQTLNPDSALAIDLGLDNLATCVDTNGASFILDGKKLKSINQWYNKQNASLQSIKDKQGIKGTTERQARILKNRNNKIRDYLNKAARYIVNHCIDKSIGKLIIGVNPGWKQEINIGKRNNQGFTQIPHWSFRKKIEGLCQRYGIEYIEQEESYTSKASFLDLDPIPIFKANDDTKHNFSGRRISRGLYKAKAGQLINADCNGAANILRKSNHSCLLDEVASGLLASPLRIRIA